MKFAVALGAAALALAVPAIAQIAPPAQSAQSRTYKVADNISVAVHEDRNTTVVEGGDSLLIIETNYRERAEGLKALIATISPKPVRIAVNSHWHADHVGGNALFARDGAVTVAHENTRKRMQAEQRNRLTGAVQQPAFAPEFLPMITFRTTTTLHFAGEDIEATFYPDGHTDSDVAFRFPGANVIYVGGLMNYEMYAGVRSPDAFVAALDKVLAQADDNTKIIPWRGPLVGKRELQEWRNVLATTRDRVAAMIREGRTVDQIIAAKPTAEFDAKWTSRGGNPANFVRQIHAGLTQPLD